MFRGVAFNIEAREARRSKLLRESHWKFEATFDFGNGQYSSFLLLTCHGFMVIKNQTTRLLWNTAAVKNCLFAMAEGIVIQGDGDKEVGVKKSLCFGYVLFAFYSTFVHPCTYDEIITVLSIDVGGIRGIIPGTILAFPEVQQKFVLQEYY
ncbi:hypothetical protein V6N13_138976 [Hibiscus sabdariffa]